MAFNKNDRAALISVYDKTDIQSLAHGLYELGYTILASGGTYKVLREHFEKLGLDDKALMSIDAYTGSPEILGGRVKTLHPKIHGGILAQRNLERDKKDVALQNIFFIDVVVVNLYPFEETIKMGGKNAPTITEAIEKIDIGGVTLLRAASKNYEYVTCLVSPKDYTLGLTLLKKQLELKDSKTQELCLKYRKALMAHSFAHTAHYEAVIAEYMSIENNREQLPSLEKSNDIHISKSVYKTISFELKEEMRYGENPHQQAALYAQSWPYPDNTSIINATQIHGKQLSFNNIRDAEAAINIAKTFVQDKNIDKAVAVGVKHGTPCGVALADTLSQAWSKCYKADSVSIFGGIVALSSEVDEKTAMALSKIFLEIIIAPKFSKVAKTILTKKKNIRLLELPLKKDGGYHKRFKNYVPPQLNSVNGAVLIQDSDRQLVHKDMLKTVTKKKPTKNQIEELLFAWNICKYVKSNAIVVTKNRASAGIGAGQMNRVGAALLALEQAKANGSVKGAVMASDAFFPMGDTVELAAKYGISAIIQPGGSIRDNESIEACNKYGIAMLCTGVRHFLH